MKKDEAFDILLTTAATTGTISLVVGVAKGIIQAKHGSLGNWVRGITSSVIVGIAIGWWLHDSGLGVSTQAALISICAYVADDVLLGLIAIAGMFSRDPPSFVARFIRILKGEGSE